MLNEKLSFNFFKEETDIYFEYISNRLPHLYLYLSNKLTKLFEKNYKKKKLDKFNDIIENLKDIFRYLSIGGEKLGKKYQYTDLINGIKQLLIYFKDKDKDKEIINAFLDYINKKDFIYQWYPTPGVSLLNSSWRLAGSEITYLYYVNENKSLGIL